MKRSLIVLALAALALGCGQPKEDAFKSQKPAPIAIAPDTLKKARADSMKTVAVPDSLAFGFTVTLKGPAELHFTDSRDNHTGPASAEEYLPILEAALKNPNLHEQERAGLENMKATIQRTGSAAGFYTARRIPNLRYTNKGPLAEAQYKGGDALDLRIVATEPGTLELELRAWNRRVMKTARYSWAAAAGQEGGLDASAVIEDFTLTWDTNNDGEPDQELQPTGLDSALVVKK